jgi:hypothetical protein
MEAALIALLLADPGVTAALSTRINWGRKPQDVTVKPYAVLQKISGLPDYTMRAPSGLISSRIQIDFYGDTYTSTRKAANAVTALLSGYSGTVSGKLFQGVFQDSDRDLPAADAGDTTTLFRTSIDFIIWHD